VIAVNILLSLVGTMPATALSAMVVAVDVTVVAATFVLMFDLMLHVRILRMVVTMLFTRFVLLFDVKIATMFVTMLLKMLLTMYVLRFEVRILAIFARVVVFVDNSLSQGLRWLLVMLFLIVNSC
jgi:hypothetical protein